MCDDNGNTQINETTFKYHIIDDREETVANDTTIKIERKVWGNQLEFFSCCICTTVGLGNLLRFPYLCFKNGGGAFLIPYIITLCFIGIPLLFMEFALGQLLRIGALGMGAISPMFIGVGYGMIFVSGFISIYYNIIIGQCIYYFCVSFTSVLPWASCNNSWNNPYICYDGTDNSSILEHRISPSEEYYDNFVLNKSARIEDMGLPQWRILICFAVAWVIVIIILLKGITYMGKASYVLALFPYIILTILLIRGLFLPGSLKGILYYVYPDFKHLTNPVVWVEAATQIFFSLSLFNGNHLTMSSYNNFKDNCLRDAVLVAIINCATSVYGGFVIFSNMGFMAHIKNVTMSEVVQGGLGLAFKVYPEALTKMPLSPLWSVLFFLMLIILGVGSQITLVETVLSGFQDDLAKKSTCTSEKRKIIYRISICVILFVIGIPMTCRGGMYLLEIFDEAINGYPMLVLALVELLVVSYCYGIEKFQKGIKIMIGHKLNIFWKICWMGISPVAILVLIIALVVYSIKTPPKLSPGFVALQTIISIIPILLSVVVLIVVYCKNGGWVLFTELKKPQKDWKPINIVHKEYVDRIGDLQLEPLLNNGAQQSSLNVIEQT